ncbi:hypothetical protein Back11_58330 [Paenibacillus baekrokdamisoli]|uniref:Uncharacterized protein n=1 Tax=Paenibacillus baekrokdamisoli TaxID=1712516 RepID=A0A3G9JK45_9BACL|nr:hypothetical protein [Paenibacillus baekrokdamisoli]MBB3071481.1 malic enzyme [Paenibacillus baekrokdamisoli]BBH24488.1 hypothetical protein Back11_58330 [Paenibacillus baekrokdamisoli]
MVLTSCRDVTTGNANPHPEIDPEEALPHVRVYATGRSDYLNQINNVLVYLGVFCSSMPSSLVLSP